jgi:hypothetical protein
MTYNVTHYAYCGMEIPLGTGFTHEEARQRFERRISWFQRVFNGEVLREGLDRAELCEPDGCMLVPDECGILRIEKE